MQSPAAYLNLGWVVSLCEHGSVVINIRNRYDYNHLRCLSLRSTIVCGLNRNFVHSNLQHQTVLVFGQVYILDVIYCWHLLYRCFGSCHFHWHLLYKCSCHMLLPSTFIQLSRKCYRQLPLPLTVVMAHFNAVTTASTCCIRSVSCDYQLCKVVWQTAFSNNATTHGHPYMDSLNGEDGIHRIFTKTCKWCWSITYRLSIQWCCNTDAALLCINSELSQSVPGHNRIAHLRVNTRV